ncbi:MAG: DMP19 family protein [Agriterribacter sp.]
MSGRLYKRIPNSSELDKAQQAIYIIWCLEAEINNGGFNQFYYNSSGQYAELTPDALILVGALKFADLTARANQVYKKEREKIVTHQDGTLEGFSKSYDDNPLNKFDNEFYDLYEEETLQKIQIDFIRNHKQDFIDK